ncbi:aminotransferase class IV [Lysinibacter sp. HNR]|uniref:aminotransferase class IV n=1 Tax=Lysinibacter sp. HNR TaxID=3031408 RepID=UPI0024348344|nr:aminotransferase class IV [Lysinibacter sp. HNR]WGD36416.1 aminotransferase class IV [Lysinibacter sp. HNR]
MSHHPIATERLFLWRSEGKLHEIAPDTERSLLAADSHRVSHGQVVALHQHHKRFRDFSRGIDASLTEQLDAYYRAAGSLLGDGEEWFPRYEILAPNDTLFSSVEPQQKKGPILALLIRPAPLITPLVSAVSTLRDPRHSPTIKGPDIPALACLNSSTRTEDIYAHNNLEVWHETIMCTPGGGPVEGTTTSLLFWRGETLFHIDDTAQRISSITEGIVRRVAKQEGSAIRPETAPLERIIEEASAGECEVWAVNALHGIRAVIAINNTVLAAPKAERLERFSLQRSHAKESLSVQ